MRARPEALDGLVATAQRRREHKKVMFGNIVLKEFETVMKITDNDTQPGGNAEQIDKLRKALHKRLSHGEFDSSWRLDALTSALQMDPVTLHVCWIQPLLDAGVSLEAAITCIAQAHLLPN